MKAVFDTNIFISALAIQGGQAERAIDMVIDGRVELFISKPIIHEVLGVLAEKFSRDADIMVTGDKAMLNLKRFAEIRIITLRRLLDEVAGR